MSDERELVASKAMVMAKRACLAGRVINSSCP